ncbi:MAG: circadian clock protein KaiC [Ilumatobacteraceae bacterium]|nr:circadian clock protein KaiC [Ilumatobacteraceae bacterium]
MRTVEHCETGISGLDEITNGGLPRGRTTLLSGGPGCGKTLFGSTFLTNGAARGEPGVFIAFEEREDDLVANARSLGQDLQHLIDDGMLEVDYVQVDRDQIQQTGDFDLEALFIRLDLAIRTVGAKRVVIDTLEVLFSGLDDTARLRAELRRLFRWLGERGVTSIVTAERGDQSLTRYGFEEYVSDCVIVLDHRVSEQLATRRLRVVKFRGSAHGLNEYPYLIDDTGISVVPITSFDLSYAASTEIISTGVADLDAMMSTGGVYRGTTTMVSGGSGTGKTTLAAALAEAACARGDVTSYFAFEESVSQIVRNMRSVGIELQPALDSGTLHLVAGRPTQVGLEHHLAVLHRHVEEVRPDVVVLDPITDFQAIGSREDIKGMLMRMVDFLKQRNITSVFTSLTSRHAIEETSVSSLIDTWIQLGNEEVSGRLHRSLYLRKSRGMAHSERVRELVLGSHGIHLVAIAEPGGVDVSEEADSGRKSG